MAMRQRSGGVTATAPQQSRPSYRDFRPQTDQREEAAATILVLHLPGFVKERVKVTYVQSTRMLRVSGERPIGGNRWSRFNEVFPVPENCDQDKIQGKFNMGILTITIPKKIIAQVHLAEEDKTVHVAPSPPKSAAEPKPQEAPKEVPPKPASTSGVEKQREERIDQPQVPEKTAAEPKVQKTVEDVPSKATSTTPGEGQRVAKTDEPWSPEKDITPPKATSITDTPKQTEENSVEKKDGSIKEKGKAKETKESEIKGKESVQKSSGSGIAEKAAQMISKQPKEDLSADKGMGIITAMGSAKEKVKNLAKRLNEEDRQTLINVGAAVLVIVALGAYVSYRYSSSGNPKTSSD